MRHYGKFLNITKNYLGRLCLHDIFLVCNAQLATLDTYSPLNFYYTFGKQPVGLLNFYRF